MSLTRDLGLTRIDVEDETPGPTPSSVDTGSSSSQHPIRRCMFFDLPAEFRNTMYEEVLYVEGYDNVYDMIIYLSLDSRFQVPSILQACRKTRHEASRMYFKNSLFILELDSCKADFLQQWINMAIRYAGALPEDPRQPTCMFEWRTYEYEEDWRGNLLEWCRLVHRGDLPVWEPDDWDLMNGYAAPLVVAALDLAWQFRGQRWERFLDAFNTLEGFRRNTDICGTLG